MPTRPCTSRRPSLLWAVLGSATFHVVVIVALLVTASGWLASRERSPKDDPSALGGAGATAGQSDPDDGPSPIDVPAVDLADRDPAALARLLRDQAAEADRMTDAERLDKLQAQTDWLASRDPGNLQKAAQRVTSFVGAATGRKLAPDPHATGDFDGESAALYDIANRTESDGRVVYDWTLVDRAGRSFVTTYDAADMTQQDLVAARVFDMARDNPSLRTLVDTARAIVESKPHAATASDAMPR